MVKTNESRIPITPTKGRTKAELIDIIYVFEQKYKNLINQNSSLNTKIAEIKKAEDVITLQEFENYKKQVKDDNIFRDREKHNLESEIKRLKAKIKILESKSTDEPVVVNHVNDSDIIIEKLNNIESLMLELKESKVEQVKSSNKGGRRAFDNIEVINLMKELHSEGNGYKKIAGILNNKGIKTKNDKDWSSSSVKFILDRHKGGV